MVEAACASTKSRARDQRYLAQLKRTDEANKEALEIREARMWTQIYRHEEGRRHLALMGMDQGSRMEAELLWQQEAHSEQASVGAEHKATLRMLAALETEESYAHDSAAVCAVGEQIARLELDSSRAHGRVESGLQHLAADLESETQAVRQVLMKDAVEGAVAEAVTEAVTRARAAWVAEHKLSADESTRQGHGAYADTSALVRKAVLQDTAASKPTFK